MSSMLTVKELHAQIEGTEILKGVNLSVGAGEIHAIMGPNGAGKSTLAKVLAGHPDYEVTAGEITLADQNLLELEPDERSHRGLFISFQYPLEIPGVTNYAFLQAAVNAKRKALGDIELSAEAFERLLDDKMALMAIKPDMKHRNLNEGFSGGEKKRNEILQMAMIDPLVAILDETDSGLDIDAMRIVATGVNSLMHPGRALVLITHYQRLLDYIRPDFIHVMVGGRIVLSGGPELASELEERGYDWLTENGEERVGSSQ